MWLESLESSAYTVTSTLPRATACIRQRKWQV
jgi:hypothetical protein